MDRTREAELQLDRILRLFDDLHEGLDGKERVPLAKLQWEAVKWLASKRVPEQYGDGVKMSFAALTDEELIRLAAEYGIALTNPASDHCGTDLASQSGETLASSDVEEPLQ